jgi:hypothetical protein
MDREFTIFSSSVSSPLVQIELITQWNDLLELAFVSPIVNAQFAACVKVL